MKRTITLTSLLVALGCVGLARAPIGNVSSSQPLTLDGQQMAAAGVTSWPIVVGDELKASNVPATLSFNDGSRIKLAPQSQIKISGTTQEPRLVLVAGNLEYKLAPGSALSLVTEKAPAANETAGAADPQDTTPPPNAGPPAVMVVHSAKFYFLTGMLATAGAAGLAGGVFAAVNGGLPTLSNH